MLVERIWSIEELMDATQKSSLFRPNLAKEFSLMEANVFIQLMMILGRVYNKNPVLYELSEYRMAYAIGFLTNGGTIGSNQKALKRGDQIFLKFPEVNTLKMYIPNYILFIVVFFPIL